MSEHTPSEWETDGQHLFPVGDSPNILACLYVPRGGTKVLIANALFIVRACNAHNDLLAACEAAKAQLDLIGNPFSDVPDVTLQIEAAIAKAKGE